MDYRCSHKRGCGEMVRPTSVLCCIAAMAIPVDFVGAGHGMGTRAAWPGFLPQGAPVAPVPAKRVAPPLMPGDYVTPGGAKFRLSIDDARFHCDESFAGGFDSCRAEISVSYTSDYNGNDAPNVTVECDVRVRLTDRHGFQNTVSKTDSMSFYGARSSGELEVYVDVWGVEPVVRASIADIQCEILHVF